MKGHKNCNQQKRKSICPIMIVIQTILLKVRGGYNKRKKKKLEIAFAAGFAGASPEGVDRNFGAGARPALNR